MKILDLYVGKTVIGGALLVMCVLLSLFVFIDFISELERIGQGSYTAWTALQFVLLSVPRLAYELMPLAALLGSLIGLGLLASNNELVVMRACGVSLARIGWAAVKAGLLLVVVSVWLGEWVVAESEQYATDMRATALSGATSLRTQDGFWTRDGASFIRVATVLPERELAGIEIYEFDDGGALRRVSHARGAVYDHGQWLLRDVAHSEIGLDGIATQRLAQERWDSRLDPALLDVIAVKPSGLSISGLYRYINYLRDNALDTARYEVEFWTKLMLPFATGVMVFAALPFVFGPLRSVGVGQRMLVGILVGLGFYLINQAAAYVGLVYGFNAALIGILPTALLFIGTLLFMRRLT